MKQGVLHQVYIPNSLVLHYLVLSKEYQQTMLLENVIVFLCIHNLNIFWLLKQSKIH